MVRIAVMLVSLAALPLAQTPANLPHTVLTRTTGPVQSRLVAVDPVTGTATTLPAFTSSALAPLALAQDPFDGAWFVALDTGAGTSRVVRLVVNATAIDEYAMATFPGVVTALEVAGERLLVGVGGPAGGVHVMPRRGGVASLVFAQPNLAAMQALTDSVVTLAWNGIAGSPAVQSGTLMVDVDIPAILFGPFFFPPPAAAITGVHELPTAVPRQLISFADGTFAMFAGLLGQPLQPLATSPAIPNGGAVALHPAGQYAVDGLGVGGPAFPFLYRIEPFSGSVTVVSATLPGAPVDAIFGATTVAHVRFFGSACGPVSLAAMTSGLPQLGTTMAFGVVGPPNTLVVTALGLDDFAGALPLPMFGGCLLQAMPEVVLAHITAGNGTAWQPLVVPNATTLLGLPVFAQWAHVAPAVISVSESTAARVGW